MRKGLLLALVPTLMVSCEKNQAPVVGIACYVEYAARGGNYAVRTVSFLKEDSSAFIYIRNGDSIRYDLRKRIITSNGSTMDTVDEVFRKGFLVNDKYYPVERWGTGLYTRDGDRYYYISSDFGLLGTESGTWRSFSKLFATADMPDPLPILLADLAFAKTDWKDE